MRYYLWYLQARSGLFQGGLVLSYHSISEDPCNVLGLSVSPRHFAEQLEVLSHYFNPIPLSELLQRLRLQKSLRNLVALTFDDGYADNLYHALPILQKYQVPATIFVMTGAVEGQTPFYWEILKQVLLMPKNQLALPHHLKITCNKVSLIYPLMTLKERLRAYHALRLHLTGLYAERRTELLSKICHALNQQHDPKNPDHRPLTISELQTLSKSPLITIGSHTVSHPRLDKISPKQGRWELIFSRRQLSEWIGKEVRYFAYPYGLENRWIRNLVQEAGYEAACGTQSGGIIGRTQVFSLPRLHVGDWPGERLASYLGK